MHRPVEQTRRGKMGGLLLLPVLLACSAHEPREAGPTGCAQVAGLRELADHERDRARAAARQARDLGSRRAPATTEDENAIARERDWQIAANEALVRARRHESEAQRIEREASELEFRLTEAGMDCGG